MITTFGLSIRQLRHERKMTQEELANELGITPQTISKWERGKGLPDMSLLVSISNVLNTSIDQLIGNDTTGRYTSFRKAYNSEEYYWGIEPSDICYDILRRSCGGNSFIIQTGKRFPKETAV